MSEIMMGVLCMPDELFWSDDPVTRFQHNQIRRQAADEIHRLSAEVQRLREDVRRYRLLRDKLTILEVANALPISNNQRLHAYELQPGKAIDYLCDIAATKDSRHGK